MISIVALINVYDLIKDGDNDNNMRIEESINSVVEQTYKKWELRIVLYVVLIVVDVDLFAILYNFS